MRAAWQAQIDTVVENLVTAITTAIVADHAEIALIDIFGREEEAVVVAPHGSLNFTPIASYVDQAAIVIGAGRARIGGIGIDLVAPGQRRAPAIVVESPWEVVTVGSAVAFCAVVGVVEVKLGLVAAEAVVLSAIDRRVIVDSHDDRFAVPPLDQGRRKDALAGLLAGSIGPDAVRLLRREVGMEALVRPDLGQRHDVADLGEELGPPLMGKEGQAGLRIGWSAAFDRAYARCRIDEIPIAG